MGQMGHGGRYNKRAALNPRQLTPQPPRLCNDQDQDRNGSTQTMTPPGWGEVWRPDDVEVVGEAGQNMKKREGGRQNRRAALNPRHQTPPRLCNVQEQKWNESWPSQTMLDSVTPSTWGEVWRQDDTEVGEEASQALKKRELSSSDDGEWKVVKGRRNSRGTPSPKSGQESQRKKTPEARDHRHVNKRSPDQAHKSPPYRYSNKQLLSYRDRINLKLNSPDNAKLSPTNNRIISKHEELMKKIPHTQIMMVSDLPDEKIARTKSFTPSLVEQKRRVPEQEENIQFNLSEILSYLRETWQQTCIELEESKLQWQPSVVYYTP